MMREIGSEFWTGCTPLDGDGVNALLPAGMKANFTLSGRTALELVLRDVLRQRAASKAYLPSYCCHTMIEPFVTKGIRVVFYDVYFTDTGIDCDFCEDNDCDLVFLMDYFGFVNPQTMHIAARQKQRGKIVVYDATHAMFCEGIGYGFCDYVFGSFRKWFSVNAGFCAKAGEWNHFPALEQNSWYTQQRNAGCGWKQQYMSGSKVDKNVFLNIFSCAEDHLETDYIGYAPDVGSLEILKTVNVAYVRKKRRENAAFSIDAINASELPYVVSPYKVIGDGDCPLFVPLRTDPSVRTTLRRMMTDRQVYLPIHWPLSLLHQINPAAQTIYERELSLVCDQRYEKADMQRMVQLLRSFNNA